MKAVPKPTKVPRTLLIASAVAGVQGVGLLVAGAIEFADSLAGHPNDRFTAVFLGVLTMVYALVVIAIAIGLRGGRSAAATPALMVEFFAVVIGVGQWHTLPALSIALIATAVAAFAALLHPDSRPVVFRER